MRRLIANRPFAFLDGGLLLADLTLELDPDENLDRLRTDDMVFHDVWPCSYAQVARALEFHRQVHEENDDPLHLQRHFYLDSDDSDSDSDEESLPALIDAAGAFSDGDLDIAYEQALLDGDTDAAEAEDELAEDEAIVHNNNNEEENAANGITEENNVVIAANFIDDVTAAAAAANAAERRLIILAGSAPATIIAEAARHVTHYTAAPLTPEGGGGGFRRVSANLLAIFPYFMDLPMITDGNEAGGNGGVVNQPVLAYLVKMYQNMGLWITEVRTIRSFMMNHQPMMELMAHHPRARMQVMVARYMMRSLIPDARTFMVVERRREDGVITVNVPNIEAFNPWGPMQYTSVALTPDFPEPCWIELTFFMEYHKHMYQLPPPPEDDNPARRPNYRYNGPTRRLLGEFGYNWARPGNYLQLREPLATGRPLTIGSTICDLRISPISHCGCQQLMPQVPDLQLTVKTCFKVTQAGSLIYSAVAEQVPPGTYQEMRFQSPLPPIANDRSDPKYLLRLADFPLLQEKMVRWGPESFTRDKIGLKVIPKVRLLQGQENVDEVANEVKWMEYWCWRNNEGTMKEWTSKQHFQQFFGAFQTPDHIVILSDLCPLGDLETILSKQGEPFHEDLVRHFLRELVVALSVLQSRFILHRNLKLSNILLDSRFHLKISDFSKMIQCDVSKGQHPYAFCSDPLEGKICPAPELQYKSVVGNGKYGLPLDVWDLGVIAHAMVFNCYPQPVQQFVPLELPAEPEIGPEGPLNLLPALLCSEPCMRPRPGDLLADPYFQLDYEGWAKVWKHSEGGIPIIKYLKPQAFVHPWAYPPANEEEEQEEEKDREPIVLTPNPPHPALSQRNYYHTFRVVTDKVGYTQDVVLSTKAVAPAKPEEY